MNNQSWPKDMNVQTTSRGTEMAKHDCVTIEQRIKTTAAEVCWNLADKAETEPLSGDGSGGRGGRNRRYYE